MVRVINTVDYLPKESSTETKPQQPSEQQQGVVIRWEGTDDAKCKSNTHHHYQCLYVYTHNTFNYGNIYTLRDVI